MLPSASLTASASRQAEFSELNLHGLLPCCVRFAPTSHPVNGNTRYRPACSLWPCGICTRWIPSRSFTVSSSVPPLPSFSQRDNEVGGVKSVFFCFSRPSRTPVYMRRCAVLFGDWFAAGPFLSVFIRLAQSVLVHQSGVAH